MKNNGNNTDILSKEGHFTINSLHLKKVLTSQEYDLLDLIRYENSVSSGYISYSLIQLEIGIVKRDLIANVKRNLIALDFISIVDNCRTKGTKYTINYKVIADLVHQLNNEQNSVNRLKIADRYRTEKRLKSIVSNRIAKFENTNFDISVDTDRFINTDTKMNIQVNCKEVKELNELYNKFNNKIISERQYKVMSNNIKASAKEKIIFNKEQKQWIINTKQD